MPGLILRIRGLGASWVYRFRSPTNMRVDASGKIIGPTRELGLGSAMRETEAVAEKRQ